MREIKFRAWDKKEEFMDSAWLIDWEHGKVCHSKHNQSELDDCVLMQYIGLKDKNGVEVYEGDIISFDLYGNEETEKGIIMFDNGSFVAQTDFSPALDGTHHGHPLTYELGSLIRNDKDVKVIGNIYENPDLLEVAK